MKSLVAVKLPVLSATSGVRNSTPYSVRSGKEEVNVKYFHKRALEWLFCLNARCAFRKGSWKVPESASGCSMV